MNSLTFHMSDRADFRTFHRFGCLVLLLAMTGCGTPSTYVARYTDSKHGEVEVIVHPDGKGEAGLRGVWLIVKDGKHYDFQTDSKSFTGNLKRFRSMEAVLRKVLEPITKRRPAQKR